MWFIRALDDSAPDGTGWRRPMRDLYAWLREAARHLRGARKASDDSSPSEHIEALEGVLDKLTKAHDWTRRFPSLVKKLEATKTLWAFERLVKLGCVPDALAFCIQQQEQTPSESELGRKGDRLQRRELKSTSGPRTTSATGLRRTMQRRSGGIGSRPTRGLPPRSTTLGSRTGTARVSRRTTWKPTCGSPLPPHSPPVRIASCTRRAEKPLHSA